jgi:hypothetical protein
MSTANQDAHNLYSVTYNGLIREDVMNQIWDISNIPLPFTDRIGSGPAKNQYTEWTRDELGAVDLTNAAVDGADTTGDDSAEGTRVGNMCQIMVKKVRVSTRARKVDTIGFADSLPYQLMQRQRELRRDYEAIMLEPQASVRGTDTVAGKLGGFAAWLETNTDRGATGTDGGFNTSTGIVDAPGNGTIRALSEATIRDQAEGCWNEGSTPTVLMSVTDVIRKLSAYMFTSTASIATLQRDRGEMGPAQAQGSVNVFITDFGVTLELIANRLQQLYNSATAANVFIFDPALIERRILHDIQTEELSKTGLADNRLMSMDVSLAVLSEKAHAVIADVDPTAAVVA